MDPNSELQDKYASMIIRHAFRIYEDPLQEEEAAEAIEALEDYLDE